MSEEIYRSARRAMRSHLAWTAGIICVAILAQGAVAFAAGSASREERIQDEATDRLARVFRVTPRSVTDPHDQKLDLGEVAVLLALAEAGRTSPDAILSLWASGRLNWGDIAEQLKVNQRDLLRRLETVRRELARRGR
jgi:hypothetical protein